jgi:hypothetical protein
MRKREFAMRMRKCDQLMRCDHFEEFSECENWFALPALAGARAIPSAYTTTKFHGRVPGGSPDTQHYRGIQQCSDSHGYRVWWVLRRKETAEPLGSLGCQCHESWPLLVPLVLSKLVIDSNISWSCWRISEHCKLQTFLGWIDSITVKTSNFGPHGNLGPFVAGSIAPLGELFVNSLFMYKQWTELSYQI